MAGETVLTVIGNLTSDPELRFTASGVAVAGFTIASTPRSFDKNANEWKDGDALFLRCTVWRIAAENAAESLRKGDRVIASGRLEQRSFETKEGEKRTVLELQVDDIGPSIKFHAAKSLRPERGSGGGGRPAREDDPWGQPPPPPGRAGGAWSDEPPFVWRPRVDFA